LFVRDTDRTEVCRLLAKCTKRLGDRAPKNKSKTIEARASVSSEALFRPKKPSREEGKSAKDTTQPPIRDTHPSSKLRQIGRIGNLVESYGGQ
jgi:hypothetical protein